MQEKFIQMAEGGEYLKKAYNGLKIAASDKDVVVKFQAENALAIHKEFILEQLTLK
jgi:hypothetical protein